MVRFGSWGRAAACGILWAAASGAAFGQTAPQITDVVNGALFDHRFAPSSYILIYGIFTHGAGRDYSISVGGVSSGINVEANSYFLTAQIPATAPLGSQTLTVTYQGVESNAFPVTILPYALEFNGTGYGIEGSNTPPSFQPYFPFQHFSDSSTVTPQSPAAPGEEIIGNLSGLGQSGSAAPVVTVGGSAAQSQLNGTGGQFVFLVPQSAAQGNNNVVVAIGTAVSNTAVLAVGNPFAALPTPVFAAGGLVNAASYASGGLVPGEIATVFGTGLTQAAGINLASSLPLAESLDNAVVVVNGIAAPIFAVDNVNGQQQINFQVPWEAGTLTTATIQVIGLNGAGSAQVTVPILAAQPGIFSYSAGGVVYGAILHANDQLADTAHPAAPGETVLIYCTGLGAVSPQPADGAAAGGSSKTAVLPTVTIGGADASVSFSGLAPGFVGLYQINAVLPGVAPGNQPVVVSISGAAGNTVMLPVS